MIWCSSSGDPLGRRKSAGPFASKGPTLSYRRSPHLVLSGQETRSEGKRAAFMTATHLHLAYDEEAEEEEAWYQGFPTRMVYLKHDIKGSQPEWCISSISRAPNQNGVSQAWYQGFPTRMVYLKHDIEGSQPEWCISSMISRVPNQNGVSQAWYQEFPTRMVYLKHDIEGSQPEWCISSMMSRVPNQNGVSQAWYWGFPTRMVFLKHDVEGSQPEWCFSSISRVPNQNGVSLLYIMLETPFWSRTLGI